LLADITFSNKIQYIYKSQHMLLLGHSQLCRPRWYYY